MLLGYSFFCAWLAEHLFHRGLIWAGGGWVIFATFFFAISIAVLRNLRPGESKPPSRWAPDARVIEKDQGDEFVELMASSDVSQIEAATALLSAHSIAAHVLGAHAATMLRFLPSANARLVVHKSDLERSLEILKSVPESAEENDSEES